MAKNIMFSVYFCIILWLLFYDFLLMVITAYDPHFRDFLDFLDLPDFRDLPDLADFRDFPDLLDLVLFGAASATLAFRRRAPPNFLECLDKEGMF